MSKIKLNIDQVLQGDFQIKPLNLLLVFQVNCPGCFVYALPLAEKLHQQYGDRVNVLGLSTAFEDFELNTADHTRRLLVTGEVVGVTKLYFQQHGQQSYTSPISFPVAFDRFGEGPALFDDDDVDYVCHLTPSFSKMDASTQTRVRARVKQTLQSYSPAAYTFRINQLQGTPSWVLFDDNFTVLAQWFGHKSETDVNAIIAHALESVAMIQP